MQACIERWMGPIGRCLPCRHLQRRGSCQSRTTLPCSSIPSGWYHEPCQWLTRRQQRSRLESMPRMFRSLRAALGRPRLLLRGSW